MKIEWLLAELEASTRIGSVRLGAARDCLTVAAGRPYRIAARHPRVAE
jgi:hypothetical protein